ncbi:MAG TPA: hypothetical protein VI114_07105, partial [Chthoniobacterales bacterium]
NTVGPVSVTSLQRRTLDCRFSTVAIMGVILESFSRVAYVSLIQPIHTLSERLGLPLDMAWRIEGDI